MLKTMDDLTRQRISLIARNAISEIDRIAVLVSSRNTTGNRGAHNNEAASESRSRHGGNTTSSNRRANESSVGLTSHSSRLTELQQRFPTAGAAGRRNRGSPFASPSVRGRNYGRQVSRPSLGPGARSNGLGRPRAESVVKDIVIVSRTVDKTPLGRMEKLNLELKGRIINGFIIRRQWDEETLYRKVKEQFPVKDSDKEFDFMKNCYGTLVTPSLAAGVKLNAEILLRSIAQAGGVIYVRLLTDDDEVDEDEADSRDDEDSDSENELMRSSFADGNSNRVLRSCSALEPRSDKDEDIPSNETDIEQPDLLCNETLPDNSKQDQQRRTGGPQCLPPPTEDPYLNEINRISQETLEYSKEESNPVEILRFFSNQMLSEPCSRQLDVTDPSQEMTGETNFIIVDRDNLLKTAFDEMSSITNFRLPLEVKFSGEEAEDHGGPRKEFFRLILILIKENYFNGGLKEEVADEYIMCGTLMGLSMIQRGNIPQFLGEDILDELVYSSAPSICLSQLGTGLQSVGIFQLMSNLPQFLQLFMPSNSGALTVKKLINLLPPCFS